MFVLSETVMMVHCGQTQTLCYCLQSHPTAGIFWDARDADTAADKINRISKCTSSPSIHTMISTDKDCLTPHLVNPEHTTETFTNKGRQNMQSNTFHTSMNMMTQSHHMPQLSVFKGISLYRCACVRVA